MRQLTLIAALSALALPAMADDAALLLGVSRYEDFRRVSNGLDVVQAAGDLRDAGYQVNALSNGTAADMMAVLDRFAAQATEADRLVVGLSGRFATDGTRTWMLAEDADEPTPFGLDDAISVDMLLQVMANTPGQSVLVLAYDEDDDTGYDAYLRAGLGQMDIPQGVTVITGGPRNADEVISDAITAPGGNVMAYVRSARGLQASGYVPQSLIMQTDAAAPAAPLPQVDPSLRAWNDAQEANSADGYRSFIFDYPASPYAAEARRRLDEIERDPVRIAEAEEDALNLTRNQRRDIQRDLSLLDFNTRGVDGIFGPGTRGAIRNWQQNNGYAQTSYLDREQINRLDAQASRRQAEIEAEEERAREEALRLDRDYWDETGADVSAAGLRAYLGRYPNGIYAEEAREKLRAFEPAPTPQPDNSAAQAREDALNINPVLRRLIESRLASLGYDPGQVDGRFDRDTRGAISRYQSRYNLSATGYLDQPTLARLLADTIGR